MNLNVKLLIVNSGVLIPLIDTNMSAQNANEILSTLDDAIERDQPAQIRTASCCLWIPPGMLQCCIVQLTIQQ